MAVALVVVHKTLGGHRWSNTHAIQIGVDGTSAPTDADLLTAGAGSTLTDANTNASPTNIIQSIIAFERLMHLADVVFTDVLITDGKRPTATGGREYATLSIPNLLGLQGGLAAGGATLSPGNVVLLVHRNVVGFGHKPGRMQLRGVLTDANVAIGGQRMLTWTDAATATAFNNILATAQAKLQPSFNIAAPTATSVQYVLPVYETPKQHLLDGGTIPVGQLKGSIPISGFSVVGPVGRQVPRGRKRKKV